MSHQAPLPSSSLKRSAAGSVDTTALIAAGIPVIVAVCLAFAIQGNNKLGAALCLAAIAAAFGATYLLAGKSSGEDEGNDDAKNDLLRALEENRKDSAARLGELRKSLEQCKAGADTGEHAATRDEISKLRAEIAGLRSTLNRR